MALIAPLWTAHPSFAQTPPAVMASFGQATYMAEEGGTEDVTVTLSADPERQVVVPITKTNQEGASYADYSGVPDSVTFESGETSHSFTFTSTDDTDDDDGESVVLSFGNLPDRVSGGTTISTTVSITDNDDNPPLFVSAATSTNGIEVLVTFSEAITVIPMVATLAEQYGLSTGRIVMALFNVTVAGKDNLLISSSYSGAVLTLRLETPHVRSGQEVNVAYNNIFTEEPGDVLTDSTGNPLQPFAPQSVTNASVDGTAWEFIDPPVLRKSEMHICEGDNGTYEVHLPSQPDGDVTVSTISAPQDVVWAVPETLTFSQDNWDVDQTITLQTDDQGYYWMPEGVESFWAVSGHRIGGVPAAHTYDNVVRIVVRDEAHADCPG